jgi:hypothetical protein
MSNLEFHPIANLFPLIKGEEFEALCADVKAYGLRTNIVMFEGKILDGRNRYRACMATGAEPRFIDFLGDDPFVFVAATNLLRRHLSQSQRAVIAAEMANMKRGGSGANQHASKCANLRISSNQLKPNDNTGLADERAGVEPYANLQKVSQSEAAEIMGVSRRSVQTAAKVIERGAPELIEAVRADTLSVNAATVIAELPKPQQAEIVSGGPAAAADAAKAIREGKASTLVAGRPSADRVDILIRNWISASQSQRMKFLREVEPAVSRHLSMMGADDA